MSEDRKHHLYSPSSLESLEACPCFINRQSDTLHERTIAGTKAHAVADSRKDDSTLSDEDAENVAACLDLVDSRKKLMEEARTRQWKMLSDKEPNEFSEVLEIREDYWPVDDEVFTEEKVIEKSKDDTHDTPYEVREITTIQATTAGYADTVLVSHCRTKAEILDWKFGRWPVTDAKENLQGIAYALGVFKRFPTVQEIRVWFVQPLIEHETDATFKRDQIPALELRVKTVVARAREARKSQTFETARPAVPVCNFCGNLGRCPAVAQFACKVGHKFYPLEIPDSITPTEIHSPENVNLGMRLAAVVKVWAESFRSAVTDRVLAMRCPMPEGFKLESRSNREIVDFQKLKEIALQHLTPEEFESTLSTTFGSLEEIISNKAPRGFKKHALEEFKKDLENSGAASKGDSYSFLKAIPASKKEQ